MGLRRASWCDQDSVRTPFRIVAGRGWQKPHTALLYWCVSSVHAPGHTAISGPAYGAAHRSCAQVRSPTPADPAASPDHTAHSHPVERPPAPLPGPYLCGGLCRGAAPVHGARGPASAARYRSPPRRGDSGRFEFTTARPVPNLPPPGSQRHVTTGAAEGQSPAPAAAAWGRGGALPPERAGSPSQLQRLGGRPRGPFSVAMATTSLGLWGPAGAQVSRPFCPCGGCASPDDRVAGLWSPGLDRSPSGHFKEGASRPGSVVPGAFPRPRTRALQARDGATAEVAVGARVSLCP
ncbi:hypothetical protein P7K49_025897 [Saguinus oedipus]|uniref:Uncharacterized protein n=1 Tax=Saguinus oedipus TaxID=9490 RepID=A0ABQ9UK04_SAGOE|nr:hypothetical protein P7K49_025897 [Saguinus oedipus]